MSSEYFTKRRSFSYEKSVGRRSARYISTGETYSTRETPVEVWNTQVTTSRDTLFPRMERRKARARARGDNTPILRDRSDLGGRFTSLSRIYTCNEAAKLLYTFPEKEYIDSIYSYEGPVLATQPSRTGVLNQFPSISEVGLDNEMYQLGTTAIARTIPTNPMVGAGAAIGESVEQLPRLPGAGLLGRAGNISKKFADEYLNYEFGLKPLISDIRTTAETVRNTNRILEQLRRDSGRLIRRRYQFPEEISTELISRATGRYPYPPADTMMYSRTGTHTVTRQTRKRVWFSGAYTYHFDQGSDLWAKMKRAEVEANRLYGLRLTPSLAWELAPWSWAADWVTNAGDVLSNLSAFSRDGLVLRWGYVMMDYSIADTHTLDVYPHQGSSIRVSQTFTSRYKKRLKATPYGFGLDPDWRDFSTRQLAILGALGISRG